LKNLLFDSKKQGSSSSKKEEEEIDQFQERLKHRQVILGWKILM